MGLLKRVHKTLTRAGDLSDKFLRGFGDTFISPVARELERPVVSSIRSVQALIPGGKTGKESMATPFGDVKPYSQVNIGDAAKGSWELATTVPGAGVKLATTALKPVAAPVAKMASKIAPVLQESAVKTFQKALAPTTKATKTAASRITEEALRRGVKGSLKSLMKTAQRGVEKAGKAIDDFGNLEGSTSIQKVSGVLDEARQGFFIQGAKGPVLPNDTAKTAVDYIDKLKQSLLDAADDTGNIPRESLRAFRQAWDATVEKAGGFAGKTLVEGTKADIEKMGADAIRKVLEEEVPDLGKLNKEYSFYKNLAKIIKETTLRKTGQTDAVRKGGQQLIGAIAGSTAGPVGSTIGAISSQAVGGAFSSALSRTLRANAKYKLGKLLQSGKVTLENIGKFLQGAGYAGLKVKDAKEFIKEEKKRKKTTEQKKKFKEMDGILQNDITSPPTPTVNQQRLQEIGDLWDQL